MIKETIQEINKTIKEEVKKGISKMDADKIIKLSSAILRLSQSLETIDRAIERQEKEIPKEVEKKLKS